MLVGTVLSVEEVFLPVLIVIRADSVEVGQQNRRVRHVEALPRLHTGEVVGKEGKQQPQRVFADTHVKV